MCTSKHFSFNFSIPTGRALPIQWNYNNEYVCVDSASALAHIHPYYEMYVYLSGDISFVVNHHIYDLKPGDIIFTEPNKMHHSVVNSNCIHEHYCIFFYAIDETLSTIFSQLAKQTYLHFCEEEKDAFLKLLQTINRNFKTSDCDPFIRIASIYELLSLLRYTIGYKILPEYPYPLQEILSFIDKHFAELHSLAPIRTQFFISQSSLERLFRKHLQITPYQYIHAKKMEYACRMLADGASVTDSAIKSGFSDVSHFIVDFRRRFDMTPNQYQKLMKQMHWAPKQQQSNV